MSLSDQQPPCTVSEPLPPRPDTNLGRFADDWAQVQYNAHRSRQSPADMTTRHLLSPTGAIVGFVSYRVTPDDLNECVDLYASVECIYIERAWRGLYLTRSLLQPLAAEVDASLRSGTLPRSRVKVHPVSNPQSRLGERVQRSLLGALKPIVDKHPFVTFAKQQNDYTNTSPDEASALLAGLRNQVSPN